MTDDSVEQPQDNDETRRDSNEATERQMRLQVWLNGLLVGGPSLAEAVKPAVLDGVIEDGWVRSEARNRKLSNIAQQCSAGEQTMCDVIEPDALTNFMQFLGRSIHFIPLPTLLSNTAVCAPYALNWRR
jgi:hypothetical protein